MEHAAGVGHGRDLVVTGDFVGFAGFWWPGHGTRVALPSNSSDTTVPIELMCRIAPDLREGEPTDQFRSAAASTCCDQHETDERAQVQTCHQAYNLLQHHPHLQRAAHPGPDRVRCSFEEDRRVHTCGPEPGGGLS